MNQNNYLTHKIFSQSECLPVELMLKYAAEETNAEENHLVECHTVDCPFCSDAIEGMQQVTADEFKGMLQDLNLKIEVLMREANKGDKEATVVDFRSRPQRKSRKWMYGIAASVLILCLAGFFLLRSNMTPQDIARDHYLPFSYSSSMSAGQTNFDKGVEAYCRKDYAKALSIFLTSDHPDANFLAGVCLFEQEKFAQAIQRFDKEIQNKGSLSQDADFYKALALLYQDNSSAARTILENIQHNPNHRFYSHAVETLTDLK